MTYTQEPKVALLTNYPYREPDEVMWITKEHYASNNNIALQLWCKDPESDTVEPYTTITVNTEIDLPPNHVMIKSYEFNGDLTMKYLIEQGIISEPVVHVPYNMVVIPVCELLCEKLRD